MAARASTWLRDRLWLVASAALTGAVLLGWGVYLAGPRPLLLAAYGAAIAGLLALALAGGAARHAPTARPPAAVVAVVLALLPPAAVYQLAGWPPPLHPGGSPATDTKAPPS